MKQKGLGKGLNALFSEEVLNHSEENGIDIVSLSDIEPNYSQPRKQFSEEELKELSFSIREHGVLQPIIVRKKGDRYQIVAGERRWRAARMADLVEVPVMIKHFDDKETLEVSLIENIQRQDLNSMELANAYSLLMEGFDLNQEQVADRVGKSRSAVANILRLLKLSPYVQEKLRADEITYGHARAILPVKEIDQQRELVDLIIDQQMSVREVESYVQNFLNTAIVQKKKQPKIQNPFYREIQDSLQRTLATKVLITQGKKKGKIEIEYYNDEDLARIIQMIQK